MAAITRRTSNGRSEHHDGNACQSSKLNSRTSTAPSKTKSFNKFPAVGSVNLAATTNEVKPPTRCSLVVCCTACAGVGTAKMGRMGWLDGLDGLERMGGMDGMDGWGG